MEKYLVVGSPGKYRVQPVRPGGTGYDSGMSKEAAERTKIELNRQYFISKGQEVPEDATPPFVSDDDFKSPQAEVPTEWILISKKLYENFGQISKITNTGAITTTPDTLLWYNTSSKNTRPANEIPQSAIVQGQPVKENSLGTIGNINDETLNLWIEANKEEVIKETAGVSRNSSLIELQAAAKKMGIDIPDFGEEIGSASQKSIIYNLIKNKEEPGINEDTLSIVKNKVGTSVSNIVTPKETPTTTAPQTQTPVTLYRGTESKNVDFRTAQSFIDDGWSTEKPTESEEAQKVLDSYLVTIYKDGNSKKVDVRAVQTFVDDGWSTTAPVAPPSAGSVSGQYWFRYDSGSYGTSVLDGLPENASWVWDLPEFTGSQEDYTLDKFSDFTSLVQSVTPGDGEPGDGEPGDGGPTGGGSTETSTEVIDFNNVPRGAKLADVGGKLYLMYAVPGQGQLYTGNTMYMAYEVVGNDVFAAGLLTEGATAPTANHTMDKTFFDTVAIVAGNTNQIIGIEDDPFASFVETYSEEAQLRPWLLDPEFIALQAEAAIENRDISDTEWRLTNWYQTHNAAERAWMDLELSDPAEAARQLNDLEIFYENQLSSLGVSGVPDGLVQWISSKNISGQWSDTYTAEQLKLFSDPYKSGDRDAELQNLISTSGFGDVDRTAAREREVVELYRKWLGPTLGSLTQDEVASIAGRLRDDPDYEDALIQNLKQNRLAAFSNYTNPELTYEDIARPWRNLTTSVWGQTADETQGWWQEMVKSNDFAKAQETLRTKGLEQNVTQVTQDATKALQQALGQGQISQLGVNV